MSRRKTGTQNAVARMDSTGGGVLAAGTLEAVRLGPGALLHFGVSGDHVVLRPAVVVPRAETRPEGTAAA